MVTINSRDKGAGAEREFAGQVRDWTGVRLIRNLDQSRDGGHDLIVHPEESGPAAEAFRQLAIECKRYRNVTDALIRNWWTQALAQAEDAGLVPALGYRANRSAWRVVIPLWLLNADCCRSPEIEYTATVGMAAFCHVIAENPGIKGKK